MGNIQIDMFSGKKIIFPLLPFQPKITNRISYSGGDLESSPPVL